MKYVRLSENYYNNKLIPITDNPYNHIIQDSNKPYFISMMQYDEEDYKKWKETGSLSGISGSTTNKIWWDFDSEDLEKARLDTITLIEKLSKLLKTKDENVQIAFSGRKGFSVLLETTQDLSLEQSKAIAFELAHDLETFDTKIYDNQRIFRLPLTKNEKSGLYKIPLTYKELIENQIPTILGWAKPVNALNTYNIKDLLNYYKPITLPASFLELKTEEKKSENKTEITRLDFSKKPSQWKNCKWSLLQGHFKPGERHSALMVIAATCRALGYDKNTTYYMCKSALKKQAEVYNQDEFDKTELYQNIVESVFSDQWGGGQFTCKEKGWLQDYCESLGENKCSHEEIVPRKISDIKTGFKDYVLNIDQNTIKTGLKEIDKKLPLTIGMNLGIVGAASSGKTSIALEILKNTSKAGVTSVFASLDMHRNRLYEKLLYKVSGGKSREEVYQMFQENRENDLINKIDEDYGNVYFYDRSSPTVSDIRKYIEYINSINPNKVKLVMLDYFERVNSERSEETAASKDIAGQLQDLINDFNICLVTLVQPNKHSLGSGPDTPILSYTAIKGSSFLYQSFRSILSLWRPFLNPKTKEKDKFIQFAILKNDLGELDTIDYAFEGKTGTIRELFPEERDQLEAWLKEKENEGKEKEDSWS